MSISIELKKILSLYPRLPHEAEELELLLTQFIDTQVREAKISELKQLEQPEQYEEYAKLMGSEHCTVCGFNAIEFRKHINNRIKDIGKSNG